MLPFHVDPSIGLASDHPTVPLVVPLNDSGMGLSVLDRLKPLVIPAMRPEGWPQPGVAAGV